MENSIVIAGKVVGEVEFSLVLFPEGILRHWTSRSEDDVTIGEASDIELTAEELRKLSAHALEVAEALENEAG